MIDVSYRIRHRLELKFFTLHKFYSMLIEQLIDLEKVRTDNLKFRTDLGDRRRSSYGWLVSNTVDKCLQRQIAQKISKSKIET